MTWSHCFDKHLFFLALNTVNISKRRLWYYLKYMNELLLKSNPPVTSNSNCRVLMYLFNISKSPRFIACMVVLEHYSFQPPPGSCGKSQFLMPDYSRIFWNIPFQNISEEKYVQYVLYLWVTRELPVIVFLPLSRATETWMDRCRIAAGAMYCTYSTYVQSKMSKVVLLLRTTIII